MCCAALSANQSRWTARTQNRFTLSFLEYIIDHTEILDVPIARIMLGW